MYLQTKAFVLKYHSWREGDRVYTVYTQKAGKLDIQARGTRKPQSKLAGQLVPFSLLDLNLTHGKQRYQLIGVTTLQKFEIRNSKFEIIMGYGYYLLELVHELTRPGQRNMEIFRLLVDSFKILPQLEPSPRASSVPGRQLEQIEQFKRLRVAFLLKLLKATGFNPEQRVKRGDPVQGTLERYIHHPINELIAEPSNGSLKSLFNISQYALNETVEKPLKTVSFLQHLK